MLFILIYTPCLATVAGLKREFGTSFALKSVALSLGLAYFLAVAVFQIGKIFIGG
jgi:ferrous iron transport protein B